MSEDDQKKRDKVTEESKRKALKSQKESDEFNEMQRDDPATKIPQKEKVSDQPHQNLAHPSPTHESKPGTRCTPAQDNRRVSSPTPRGGMSRSRDRETSEESPLSNHALIKGESLIF